MHGRKRGQKPDKPDREQREGRKNTLGTQGMYTERADYEGKMATMRGSWRHRVYIRSEYIYEGGSWLETVLIRR